MFSIYFTESIVFVYLTTKPMGEEQRGYLTKKKKKKNYSNQETKSQTLCLNALNWTFCCCWNGLVYIFWKYCVFLDWKGVSVKVKLITKFLPLLLMLSVISSTYVCICMCMPLYMVCVVWYMCVCVCVCKWFGNKLGRLLVSRSCAHANPSNKEVIKLSGRPKSKGKVLYVMFSNYRFTIWRDGGGGIRRFTGFPNKCELLWTPEKLKRTK